MVALENAIVPMIGDSGTKWLMAVGYPEPEIGWVTFGMQGIEKMEEFAIAYTTNSTDIYQSWFPQGMSKLGIRDPKLFTIDITVVHWGVGRNGSAWMGVFINRENTASLKQTMLGCADEDSAYLSKRMLVNTPKG
jgi:hypothetical protein